MNRRKFLKSAAALLAATQSPKLLAESEDELTSVFIPPKDTMFEDLMGNKEMKKVATIPLVEIRQYELQTGIDLMKDKAALKEFIAANPMLRTGVLNAI